MGISTTKKGLITIALTITLCTATPAVLNPFSGIVSGVASAESEVMQRAPILEWRYKKIGEYMYRRQYNLSTNQWVGEWERC